LDLWSPGVIKQPGRIISSPFARGQSSKVSLIHSTVMLRFIMTAGSLAAVVLNISAQQPGR
jgi:hypothetical protein